MIIVSILITPGLKFDRKARFPKLSTTLVHVCIEALKRGKSHPTCATPICGVVRIHERAVDQCATADLARACYLVVIPLPPLQLLFRGWGPWGGGSGGQNNGGTTTQIAHMGITSHAEMRILRELIEQLPAQIISALAALSLVMLAEVVEDQPSMQWSYDRPLFLRMYALFQRLSGIMEVTSLPSWSK